MHQSTPVNRRGFLKAGIGAAAVALLPHDGIAALLEPPITPIRLSPGPQLFLDDWLIASQQNLKRVIHSPARLPKPIVTADDKCFQPYVSVLRDPQTRRFRLWYNTAINSTRSHIGYMESEDGMNWIRPFRELENPSGREVGFGAYVIDEGPDFAEPDKRYKLAYEQDGLFIATSPDGLKWTGAGDGRVLGGIGDIISLSRDPIRKRYLLLCKVNSRPEDGYKGSTPNAAEGTRRLVGQSFSDDCIHWSPAQRIIAADAQDKGITEFYSIGQVIARGGLLIGLLKVLRDDLSPEPGGEQTGIGYTCLAWTRDGQTWQRDREPFMDRNPQPGTWDRAMTWGDCLLPVDDQVFIYYGGYSRGHKVERFKERQIGFAQLKRDRFVSRQAGAETGVLRTPPVVFEGSDLTINADIRGEVRVALLDKDGQPIQGFGPGDSTPLKGDSLSHGVRWKSALASLNRAPVQLEFQLQDASLFSFDLRG